MIGWARLAQSKVACGGVGVRTRMLIYAKCVYTSTIGGVLMEPSIVEVAYLPSLLAEWELKSPAGKCPAVGDE